MEGCGFTPRYCTFYRRVTWKAICKSSSVKCPRKEKGKFVGISKSLLIIVNRSIRTQDERSTNWRHIQSVTLTLRVFVRACIWDTLAHDLFYKKARPTLHYRACGHKIRCYHCVCACMCVCQPLKIRRIWSHVACERFVSCWWHMLDSFYLLTLSSHTFLYYPRPFHQRRHYMVKHNVNILLFYIVV